MAEEIAQHKEIDEKTAYRRESIKRSIRYNIGFYEKRIRYLHPVARILNPKDNNTILVRLRLGVLPVFTEIIKDNKDSLVEILNQLIIDVDAGKFDECIEETIARINLKRKSKKIKPYKLSRHQKYSLERYPELRRAIEKYMKDNSATESGNTEDFVIFFKQLYHKYAIEPASVLDLRNRRKIDKFNSSDDNYRIQVIEKFIKNHFRDSVDCAIYLARRFGDAEVDSEGNITDKGIDYLTDEQKKELINYPFLRMYINAYIRDMGSYPNFSEYSDFTMYFRKHWRDNDVSEEDMFPMWMEIDDRVQKQRENNDTTSDEEYNYYEQFNNSGSNSRWMEVEEFISSEFSYCVDCAIKLAEEYGDIDLHPEEGNYLKHLLMADIAS